MKNNKIDSNTEHHCNTKIYLGHLLISQDNMDKF